MTLGISSYAFVYMFLTSLTSGLGFSTCPVRQDFTLGRSFWNCELASLSFYNFASLKGVHSQWEGSGDAL